jgi:hypothetical protein
MKKILAKKEGIKMKRILIIMVGLLLIGVNVLAQGDLLVYGKLGVGTSNPLNTFHVNVQNENMGIRADNIISDVSVLTNMSAFYTTNVTQTDVPYGRFIGFNGNSVITGSGTVDALGGAENVISLNSTTGSATVVKAFGNLVTLRRGSANNQNHSVTDYYGFYSTTNPAGTGQFHGTNWRHAYFENFPNFGGTVTEVTGLWIDQQNYGTTNYGIVLAGDEAGSDIVFGPSQDASLYSRLGELYVKDGGGIETQISPHDPETGEWIFYSKNIKTGRTIRVNMEKLVRAVEKLTGEKFMIEIMAEDK